VPLEQALQYLKFYLPKHAVVVGQNVQQDIKWLGLQEGVDFAGLRDLSGLYRVWNAKFNSMSVFGQDHLAKVLLGWPVEGRAHNALEDACKSMRLFHLYSKLQVQCSASSSTYHTLTGRFETRLQSSVLPTLAFLAQQAFQATAWLPPERGTSKPFPPY